MSLPHSLQHPLSSATLPASVTLVEVGARDGLQNEKTHVAATTKIELIHRLQAAGLREIETTSFVSPKWVPQMADAADVMAGIARKEGVRYSVLTPNLKGFEGALASRADEIVVFAAASESFSQRNINCSITESIERFAPVVAAAHAAGIRVRGAVSCAMGCPYEGEVSPAAVERVVVGLKGIGVDHIGIADTIGVGTPRSTQAALEQALKHYPMHEISGHFHDTYGMALANVYAALQLGIHTFDTSVAGLGGCPYAKGATGNVATEDVVYMLHGLDIQTGIDLSALVATGEWISTTIGKPYASRAGKALWTKQQAA
jgi:hydroxymethylglutaryl-CoA lyase